MGLWCDLSRSGWGRAPEADGTKPDCLRGIRFFFAFWGVDICKAEFLDGAVRARVIFGQLCTSWQDMTARGIMAG